MDREVRQELMLEQLRERLVNQAVASSELVTKLGDAEARIKAALDYLAAYPEGSGNVEAILKGES
jgi:hypothetical protein